jgi:hypothetical protein
MDLKIVTFKKISSLLLSLFAAWLSLPAGPVVLQEAQEPVPQPAQRADSFGALLMGMWSDPWPQGPPSARLQAAQRGISVKNREKSDSGIMK